MVFFQEWGHRQPLRENLDIVVSQAIRTNEPGYVVCSDRSTRSDIRVIVNQIRAYMGENFTVIEKTLGYEGREYYAFIFNPLWGQTGAPGLLGALSCVVPGEPLDWPSPVTTSSEGTPDEHSREARRSA